MFLEESIWVRDVLASLKLQRGQSVLDIGSCTELYRCLNQPFIDYYVFRPLRDLGAKVIHVDQKEGEGVDVQLDLSTWKSSANLRELAPADVVICANLLEHVEDRNVIIGMIKKLTNPGGVILLTAPYVYRYHPDPIDTMYRPSNKELENIFEGDGYSVIASDILDIGAESVIKWTVGKYCLRIIKRIAREFNPKVTPERPIIIKNKTSVLAVRKPNRGGV